MWGPRATKSEEKVDLLHDLQPEKTSLQYQLKRRIYADGILKVQNEVLKEIRANQQRFVQGSAMTLRCPIEDSAHLTGFVQVQQQVIREIPLTIGS